MGELRRGRGKIFACPCWDKKNGPRKTEHKKIANKHQEILENWILRNFGKLDYENWTPEKLDTKIKIQKTRENSNPNKKSWEIGHRLFQHFLFNRQKWWAHARPTPHHPVICVFSADDILHHSSSSSTTVCWQSLLQMTSLEKTDKAAS